MKLSFLYLLMAATGTLVPYLQAAEPPGAEPPAKSEWQGYPRSDFQVDGRTAWLIAPKIPAPGKPWIWRTEFFGHEPQADLALLAKGFHVAYIDVQNMYGSPLAMGHMDAYHAHVTATYGLSPKTVLEGFSRGGLFAFNWAAKNPDKVAAIYVDAPVCDFKSWPGGKLKALGSPVDWANLLKSYGFQNEQEAIDYPSNPIDELKQLAAAKIPILCVYGEADDLVPPAENIRIVKQRYQTLGGTIVLIGKPNGGHHPHSLLDPTPIVDFVVKSVGEK